MDSLEKERERKEIQYDLFSGFRVGFGETGELLVDFNEKLFHRLVDYATVYSDGRVVFTFRNGVEISTKIWKKVYFLWKYVKNRGIILILK